MADASAPNNPAAPAQQPTPEVDDTHKDVQGPEKDVLSPADDPNLDYMERLKLLAQAELEFKEREKALKDKEAALNGAGDGPKEEIPVPPATRAARLQPAKDLLAAIKGSTLSTGRIVRLREKAPKGNLVGRTGFENPPTQASILGRTNNMEAALIQITGTPNATECTHCGQGRGPWTTCVSLKDELGGCCGNCVWVGAGRCSLRVTEPTTPSKVGKGKRKAVDTPPDVVLKKEKIAQSVEDDGEAVGEEFKAAVRKELKAARNALEAATKAVDKALWALV